MNMNRGDIMPKKQLPVFASEQEEAKFWDMHNSIDYLESHEPVDLELDPELAAAIRQRAGTMKSVVIRLRQSEIDQIRVIAEIRHVAWQSLVRSWIAEAIEEEKQQGNP